MAIFNLPSLSRTARLKETYLSWRKMRLQISDIVHVSTINISINIIAP